MRIAFDLDNTLIQNDYNFPLEDSRSLLAFLLGVKRLRAGTVNLCRYCQHRQWEVWVYTTSYRSGWHIRKLFWQYGIQLSGIVNQQRHTKEVRTRSTKYPPQFDIDLLIDDSEGVRIEGERHNFRVLVVSPQDEQWTHKVKDALGSAANNVR